MHVPDAVEHVGGEPGFLIVVPRHPDFNLMPVRRCFQRYESRSLAIFKTPFCFVYNVYFERTQHLCHGE